MIFYNSYIMPFSNYDNWLTRLYEDNELTLEELEEKEAREEQRGLDFCDAIMACSVNRVLIFPSATV